VQPGRTLLGRLRAQAAEQGPARLHELLAGVDPEAAGRIHPNDVQRLVRALEFWQLSGRPISADREQFAGRAELSYVMVGLRRERERLYGRINARVDMMMRQGLLDEVKGIRGRLGPQSSQAVGYKDLVAYLDGQMELGEAVEQIKRKTRRYARRQLTWLRHFPRLQWVDAAPSESAAELALRCLALLEAP